MFLNFRVRQTRLLCDLFHLFRRETLQNRKRAILANQTIVQEQMADRGVEKIGDRIAIEIDDKNPAPRNARHLPQDLDSARVIKVMQRQRLNRVTKRIVAKRQLESA